MKLLFLSHSCPLREGGTETRSREVAVRLVRRGHKVQYLCARTRNEEIPIEIYQGVKIVRKKVVPDWWLKRFPFPHYFTLAAANLLMMIHLFRLLRNERFDVLREEVAPVPVSGALAFLRLPFQKRVAVIHMLAGTWRLWTKYYGLLFGSYGFLMEKALAKGWLKYDRYIVVARWSCEHLKSYASIRDQATLIPNGVDVARFENQAFAVCKRTNTHLLSIGRLVKTKGHRYLFQALSLLKDRGLDVRLTLVGQGSLREELSHLAQTLCIQNLVHFIDAVPFEKIPDLMKDFDLFVMPSLYEGFSVVLLEALASGLPVAVSDIPGFHEIIDERTGVFFLPENAEDLADKLAVMIQNPEWMEKLSQEGKKRARYYDMSRVAAQEELVYISATR